MSLVLNNWAQKFMQVDNNISFGKEAGDDYLSRVGWLVVLGLTAL